MSEYGSAPAGASEADGRDVTLLVVEDHAPLRRLLERYFRAAGFAVVGAGSVEAALDLLPPARAIDLVLTDVDLPERSGLWLLEHVRREHGLPVVLMTGRSRVSGAAARDAANVILKPFNLPDLRRHLLRALAAAPREG